MMEPEEIVEARVVALIAAALPSVQVVGALAPVAEDPKRAEDTSVSVFVDLAEQSLDFTGPNVPLVLSVRATVHFANADEATGAGFRDACRALRAALLPLLGDGCAALDGDGFSCDAFVLNSTATSFDADAELGGMAKTYTATVNGRYTPKEQ